MQFHSESKGFWMKFGVLTALLAAANAFHAPAPIVYPRSGMN